MNIRLSTEPSLLVLENFDEVVLATGVSPRIPAIEGIEHKSVMTYIDAIQQTQAIGSRVAILGAGGIGFDVASLLTQAKSENARKSFFREWGIDANLAVRGGVLTPEPSPSQREVYLLQRKKEKLGMRLGKTTGWIHRLHLKHKKVHFWSGVTYVRVDDQGLHVVKDNQPQVLAVDSIVLCTGQTESRALWEPLKATGKSVHLIGGAYKALELDARHAIDQACRLAALI